MWQTLKYSLREAEGEGAGGGGGEAKWFAPFQTEGVELPAMVTEAPDFATFAKQAVDYQAMQGSSIRIPGENATPEDTAAFYDKLITQVPGLMPVPAADDVEGQKALALKMGVPEEAGGYELKAPEGKELDESLKDWFATTAHARKLNKDQAAGIFEDFNAMTVEKENAVKADLLTQEAQLREELGATYDPQMKKIRTLLGTYPEFNELVSNMDKGLVPAHVYRGFAKIAEGMMGEGFTMLDQQNFQQNTAITPNEAKIQSAETLNKLTALEPNDPQRKPLMDELVRLNKLADPKGDHAAPARAGFSS